MAAQAAFAESAPRPIAGGLGFARRPRARSPVGRKSVTLYAFLIAVSIPIILPYFWLVTIAFSAKTGVAETFVLWRSMFVLVPAVIGLWLAAILAKNRRQTLIGDGRVLSSPRRAFRLVRRTRPPRRQLHLPLGAGLRVRRPLAGRRGEGRDPVPECLERLRQLHPDRRRPDGDRRHRRLARRPTTSRASSFPAAPGCSARCWCCTPSRC